jgi:hypothetical protein
VANTFLNNANQVTPQGSLNYDVTGNYGFTDPTTGQTYNIPRFTVTQNMSPTNLQSQTLSDLSKYQLAGTGYQQSLRLADLLGNDINLANAPAAGDAGMLSGVPRAATTFGDGNDYSADRARVEESLFSRLNPQLDRTRTNLEQRLSDQGIRYGSTAYNDAMKDFNDQVAAQRVAVTQAGAAEQQQGFAQSAARGQFAVRMGVCAPRRWGGGLRSCADGRDIRAVIEVGSNVGGRRALVCREHRIIALEPSR